MKLTRTQMEALSLDECRALLALRHKHEKDHQKAQAAAHRDCKVLRAVIRGKEQGAAVPLLARLVDAQALASRSHSVAEHNAAAIGIGRTDLVCEPDQLELPSAA